MSTPIAEYRNPNGWEPYLTLEEITENDTVFYRISGMSFCKEYRTLRGAKSALTRNGCILKKEYTY